MWTTFFLSLYWICYNVISGFCFVFLGQEAYGILIPQPGIKPTPPALEGEGLTPGSPGKSLKFNFNWASYIFVH